VRGDFATPSAREAEVGPLSRAIQSSHGFARMKHGWLTWEAYFSLSDWRNYLVPPR